MPLFKLMLRSNGRERVLAALAAFFILLQVFAELAIPGYMTEITNLVQTHGGTVRDVLSVGARMLGYAFCSLGSAIAAAYLLVRLGADFTARMRRELFTKVQTLSRRQLGEFSLAGLITRTTNDGNHVQSLLVLGMQAFIKAPITAVWAIYRMAAHSPAWAPIVAAAVCVFVILYFAALRLSMPHLMRLQPLTDDVNRLTRENILGLPIIRERNAEAFQSARFAKANVDLTHRQIAAGRILSWLTPGNLWIGNLLSLGIYWIGVCLLAGEAPGKIGLFSDTIVFAAYAAQVVAAFALWIPLCIAYPRGYSAACRIEQVLCAEEDVPVFETEEVLSADGAIVFSHVTHRFSPDEAPVLNDVSFSVRRGEKLGIVGATGCGKSAAAQMVARLIYPSAGAVFVNGVGTANHTDAEIFRRVVYVSQKPMLFAGTVLSNLTMGEDAVCKSASFEKVRAFVTETVGTLDMEVSPGGVNLSVAQKQCLSVARALCRTGEILILDDPFAVLDAVTRGRMLDTVYEVWQNRTLVITAAHAEDVRKTDRILVMDAGHIADVGTHESLLTSCPLYRKSLENVRRAGRGRV